MPLGSLVFEEREELPDPSDNFSFLFDPIRKLFADNGLDLLPMLRRLAILAERSKNKILQDTNADWDISLAFPLLEDIERSTPEEIAKTITEANRNSFRGTSVADIVDPNSRSLRNIATDDGAIAFPRGFHDNGT